MNSIAARRTIPPGFLLAVCLLLAAGCRIAPVAQTPATLPITITPQQALLPIQAGLSTQVYLVSQADSMLPDAQSDLSALHDLPRYDLSLQLQPQAYTGSARLVYTNTENIPLDALYFRLYPNGGKSYGDGSVTVEGVSLDGQPLPVETSVKDTVLKVSLPARLAVGSSVSLEMEFAGVIPLDFGGEYSGGYGIYNTSAGVTALSGWFPILAVYDSQGWNLDPVYALGDSVYSEMAFYTVELTTPKDWVVAATGVEVGSQPEGSLLRRTFVTGPVRDFFLIASPDYRVLDQTVGGTRIRSYYLPGNEEAASIALETAAGALQTFNRRFATYPYTELDLAAAPMNHALGVEFPGIFLVSQELYADPSGTSFRITTAHEVSHQWWYNLVGNDVLDEPWLDEALATFSSGLYAQDVLGQNFYAGYTSYLEDRYAQLVLDGNDESINHSLGYFESLNNPKIYSGVVYTKGALFLQDVREKIGDEAFFKALRQFFTDHKYQIARGTDLLDALETAAGQDLDDLYLQWSVIQPSN